MFSSIYSRLSLFIMYILTVENCIDVLKNKIQNNEHLTIQQSFSLNFS